MPPHMGSEGVDRMTCNCGSGQRSWWEYDARGIPLTRVCPKCRESQLAKYRPEVLTDSNYLADEPIDPAD